MGPRALSTRDARVEARSRVWVGDAQRPAVVLRVLHGDTTSGRFLVGEKGRRVEPLIVHERLAMPSAVVVMTATQRADGTDLGTRAEHHGLSDAVVARGAILFVVSVGGARSCAADETRPAEQTGVAAGDPRHSSSPTAVVAILRMLLSPPQEECRKRQQRNAGQSPNDGARNGAAAETFLALHPLGFGSACGRNLGHRGDGLCHGCA